MKHRLIAVLCVFALTAACFIPVNAAGEQDGPVLPAEVEEGLQALQSQPPAEPEQPILPPDAVPEQLPQAEDDENTAPAPENGESLPEPGEMQPAPEPEIPVEPPVHVGLVYGGNALAGANLANSVGSGYRFGYTDSDRVFCQAGYTSETAISVVKTQNVYYGFTYGSNLTTYSDTVTSDILVGCWHVRLPGEFAGFEQAQLYAWDVGGFPAWIKGEYQVRFGAFGTQADAQAMADQVGGTVVGTSAYGVSVVKTKTNTVLFQFDGGEDISLTVKPGTDDTVKTVTNFRGTKYFGSFQFRRIDGGNLTISNFLPMNDYLNCVISQEMSPSWPLEALKAQAVTARTYYERNVGKHKKDGFDLCCTTDCQAYPGMSRATARTAQAVEETDGLRVWYNGKMAETFYFASDGGGTEDIRNVWGGKDYPYLCGVIDPYEESISDKIAYWDHQKTFTASQLTAIVQPYIQSLGYNCAAITDFQVTEYSETGNVKAIAFTDANGKVWPFTKTNAAKFRSLLALQSIRYTVTKSGGDTGGVYYVDEGDTLSGMSGVYAINGEGKTATLSSNPFVITAEGVQFLPAPTVTQPAENSEAVYTITSRGYGHNIGMSQWGAYAMAQQGMTFLDILTFYYPGVEIY